MRTQAGQSGDALVTEEASGPPHALEDLRPGQQAGRYIVVRKIGAGGMGDVYLAYDHELLRQVAVKLLHHSVAGSGGRARIRREAQALAQLSHPNVVHVYEVSTVGEQMFVAMEFVAGDTLRTWVREQTHWRTVVGVFRQAGRGLAAAHAAGLVHRDFKPENVLIDTEGRARVVDFGLARIHEDFSDSSSGGAASHHDLAQPLTQAGTAVGTVPYMAPEQHRGRSADALVDQYAFCVSLWEALVGRRPFHGADAAQMLEAKCRGPIAEPGPRSNPSNPALFMPAWIRRILLRGLDPDPARRYPSMKALLEALERDPAARRRRMLSYAAVAAAGVGIAVIPFAVSSRAGAACREPAADLRDWWERSRESAKQGVIGTGVSYAEPTWDVVRSTLDTYVDQWVAARERVCADRVADVPLAEQAIVCLDGRRRELGAFVEILMRADAEIVRRAVETSGQLSPVESCRDSEWLASRVKPPTDPELVRQTQEMREALAQASVLRRSGKPDEALAVAGPLRERANEAGYGALVAEVETELGQIAQARGAFRDARRHYERAYLVASEHHHDEVAATAATQNLFVLAEGLYDLTGAEDWHRHASMAVHRAGAPPRIVTRLYNAVGVLRADQGRYDAAETAYQAAVSLEEARMGQPGARNALAHTLGNYGDLMLKRSELVRAEALHRRSLELFKEELGVSHPDYADGLINLGTVVQARGQYETARTLFLEALTIYEQALGAQHPDVAAAYHNLGTLAIRLGNFDEAEGHLQTALDVVEQNQGLGHPIAADLLNNLGLVSAGRGDHREAIRRYTRALEIARTSLGERHPDVADSIHNRGTSARFLGQLEEAAADLERALSLRLELLGSQHYAVASSLVELGTIRLLQGNFDASQQHLDEALAIQKKAYSANHVETAGTLAILAALHEARGDVDGAMERAEESLAVFEAAIGGRHPNTTMVRFNLGSMKLESGHLDEAAELVEQTLEAWTESMGGDYPYLALAWGLQAEVALHRGNRQRARELWDKAVEHGEALPDALMARPRFLYARELWDVDRRRARALAQAAARGFRAQRAPGAASLDELRAWASRVGVELETGDPDAAQ